MADSKQSKPTSDIISQVVERINDSKYVLVALSKDPSVDELSAALGLTFILDKLEKHATAIFSGAVPNAIEFLEPEKTFETNTSSLKDFIIALEKKKADHIRYKADGDYVRIYISPKKTTLDTDDMEFSHGDYNVDLVIALNVESAADLDAALTEYGRIMHDASSINIHAGEPGRFGDLEWGNPLASSVSEMIYQLGDKLNTAETPLFDKSTATALLAGIVAATNRFSNERTSADTMAVASNLMAAGADQQLISSSIPVDILTTDVVDASADLSATSEESSAPEASISMPEGSVPEASAITSESSISKADSSETTPSETDPVKTETTAISDSSKETQAKAVEVKPGEVSIDVSAEDSTESSDAQQGAVDFDPNAESDADDSKTLESAPLMNPAAETSDSSRESATNVTESPAVSTHGASVAHPVTPPTPTSSDESKATSESLAPVSLNPAVAAEQAAALAKLDQVVSAPIPPSTTGPLMDELRNAATANEGKNNIIPPSEAMQAPTPPKDYASMMNAELSAPTPPNQSVPANAIQPATEPETVDLSTYASATAPVQTPVSQPISVPSIPAPQPNSPVASQQPTQPNPIDQMMASAELVDNPLPMPDANTILPPPPNPFGVDFSQEVTPPTPSTTQAPISNPVTTQAPVSNPSSVQTAPAPQSAQAFAQNIQDHNPAVETDPRMATPVNFSPEPVSTTPSAASSTAPSVNPVMPGVITPAGDVSAAANDANSNYLGQNPAMQDQLYPDPNAFHIPGM